MKSVLVKILVAAIAMVSATAAFAADGPAKYLVSVTLKEGTQWSDGTPLTAQDFVGGYDLIWAQGYGIWNQLTDVKAKDDLTIEFYLTDISPTILRQLVRSNQTGSSSQYGDLYSRAHQLRVENADRSGGEVTALLDDLEAFQPDTTVSYGPFYLAADNVSPTQLTLAKNPGGYNADQIGFESVVVYYGETSRCCRCSSPGRSTTPSPRSPPPMSGRWSKTRTLN